MNAKRFRSMLWGALFLFLLASCGNPKKYAYLQDIELAKQYSVEYERKLTIKIGDRINIAVASSYPELVAPFNGGGFSTRIIGDVESISTVSKGAEQAQSELVNYGYKVDSNGEINFPILGKLKIEGMTLEELSRDLERRIIASKYATDPRVTATYANLRIFLLGAIGGGNSSGQNFGGGPSTISSQDRFTSAAWLSGRVLSLTDQSKIHFLELLAMLGDLPINANLEKINVIRQENGRFVTYRMNIKKADIFNSPAFYLQQNDIVYVEARYRESEFETIQKALQVAGYISSSVATIVALIALMKK